MVVGWSKPFVLTTPLGTLNMSGTTGYVFDPERCSAGVGLRITTEPWPGGHGFLFRERWRDGVQMRVTLRLLNNGTIAVAQARQDAYDLLAAHLDRIVNEDGRIQWGVDGDDGEEPPVAYPDRMLDRVRALELTTPRGGLLKEVTFAVESRLSYALDAPETATALTDGVPVTIDRGGSAEEMLPVLVVDGPATDWSFVNAETGDGVYYDSGLPGAVALGSGDTATVDFVRGTIALNDDEAYLNAGLVRNDGTNASKMTGLVRGEQDVELTGADGTLKWQPAWAA